MAAPDYQQNAIDDFTFYTQYNISLFFVSVNNFFTNNYNDIENWYNGSASKPNVESFEILNNLLLECDKIEQLFGQFKTSFDRLYHWELLLTFEETQTRLQTTSNLNKYLRSSQTQNSWTSNGEVKYIMKKYDTLESIQDLLISSINFRNDWQAIAIRNDLKEEDYTIDGGKTIVIPSQSKNGIFLQSVIDSMIGEKLYGLDLNKKLTFVDLGDGTQDLEVLSYKETIIQALNILIGIRKGDIPEFPDLGLEEGVVVGGNRFSFNFPLLQRDLNGLFATDDTFTNFKILKLNQKENVQYIDFEVSTAYNQIFQSSIKL